MSIFALTEEYSKYESMTYVERVLEKTLMEDNVTNPALAILCVLTS